MAYKFKKYTSGLHPNVCKNFLWAEQTDKYWLEDNEETFKHEKFFNNSHRFTDYGTAKHLRDTFEGEDYWAILTTNNTSGDNSYDFYFLNEEDLARCLLMT